MMRLRTFIIIVFLIFFQKPGYGIITGSLSGVLTDKNTGQVLPGAIVQIVDTKLWTVADKYGNYNIQNIPSGIYEVRAKMLGYASLIVKSINISVDSNVELNFQMISEAISLSTEIVVVADKPLISKDVISYNYTYDNQLINKNLPIDYLQQVADMQSDVVNGHYRGGRSYQTLFLLDGQTIQDPMFKEINAFMPMNAISDINIQPSAFDVEYGQSTAGLINATTREGKDKTEGFFKIYTDNIWGKVDNDNLKKMELGVGGPLIVSFGGPIYDLNYYLAGTMNLNDARYNNDPIVDKNAPQTQNYHYSAKISFRLWRDIKIMFHNFSSNWDLYEYDNLQSLNNSSGYINQRKYSSRTNFTLMHTLNPKSFYSLSIGRDRINKQAPDEFEAVLRNEISESNDVNMKHLHNWKDVIDQRIYFFKAIYLRQINPNSYFKIGAHLNLYKIFMNNLLLLPLDDSYVSRESTQQQLVDILNVNPYTMSVFAQNKIEHEDVVIKIGLRYDYFNPEITYSGNVSNYLNTYNQIDSLNFSRSTAESQFQVSPRVGLSMPFMFSNDRIHMNYGLFFQTPPLYYLYLNSNRNLEVAFPLIGNPELEPERTQAFEIGYQKLINFNSTFGFNFYYKKIDNLVNTKCYYAGEVSSENITQFENLDYANVKGFEVYWEKYPGDSKYYGRISYSIIQANGSGSYSQSNYISSVQNYSYTQNFRTYPLAWDQRHKISLNLVYTPVQKIQVNLFARANSPLPLSNDNFVIEKRGEWRNYIDIRITREYSLFTGSLIPYFEVINLLNNKNKNLVAEPTGAIYHVMLSTQEYRYELGRRIRLGLMFEF